MAVAKVNVGPRVGSRSESSLQDRSILLQNVSWEKYVALADLIGEDHRNLTMIYLEGTLELMTRGPGHEEMKTTLARLIEVYALERDVALYGYGEMTRRRKARLRGLEPDECYMVGRPLDDKVRMDIPPDLALEVSISSGYIDKLDVYRGLEVPEVWFWKEGKIEVHQLAAGKYVKKRRSRLLPDLDIRVLQRYASMPDQAAAVRAFRDWLRAQE